MAFLTRGYRVHAGWLAIPLLWLLSLSSVAVAQVRTATDAAGEAVKLSGKLVLIEPDIELMVVTAGGVVEPRKEWTDSARDNYPLAVRALLKNRDIELQPDFDVPDDLEATSRLGQILRLHEAVAVSVGQFSQSGSVLATKKDPKTGKLRMDWTLGQGVAQIREATGADYALFTFIRDSYSTGGRTALRIFTMIAGAAMGYVVDIGGGMQLAVTTLVDLRTGQVVWFNGVASADGDLRTPEAAQRSTKAMLKGLPL